MATQSDNTYLAALAPARTAVAVTPSDTNDLKVGNNARGATALFVGGAGNLVVILADDSTSVTLNSVPAGTVLPIWVKRVLATGTTATNIVALRF